MKSGNLNFLESSGPVQACNGTALPLYVHYKIGDSFYPVFPDLRMEGSQVSPVCPSDTSNM